MFKKNTKQVLKITVTIIECQRTLKPLPKLDILVVVLTKKKKKKMKFTLNFVNLQLFYIFPHA